MGAMKNSFWKAWRFGNNCITLWQNLLIMVICMKERMKRVVRWITTKGLVWLGFGATPFIFMACYGPVPTEYKEVTFDEEVVDTVSTRNMAEEPVAVEDSVNANDEV